ncbi:MAG TPA: UDP-N-acetylmuramoyl-tripeptide--D-alanyl-D-alanine ligase, partial [Nitrospirae bacterium]|nr:UDP-N-acetylmuramoyl-tripeptide--D-alanyl-D-alanine ligase [Nitrospirota bacterium]
GERLDGHDFVRQAFLRGAVAAIVSREVLSSQVQRKSLILVDDTLKALADLAAYHRSRFKKLLVVGVTGTNGKTTVKDMTALCLSRKYKTLKTEGNLNNHIGAPLTLLRLNESHQAAVIEMGMSSPGEIAALSKIARPSIGVITNIGPAHLKGLKTVAGVRKAKSELLEYLSGRGKIVLNADDLNSRPLINRRRKNIVTFGKEASADINLVDTWSNGKIGHFAVIQSGIKEQEIHVPLSGKHNVQNALAACAVSVMAGVKMEDFAKSLKKIRPAPMRMEPVTAPNKTRIINDAYNANPDSVEAALTCLAGCRRDKGGRLLFVFGDMLELGAVSVSAHKKIAGAVKKAGVDHIFALGEMASITAREAVRLGVGATIRKSHISIARALARGLKAQDTILVKGSRGTEMERVVDNLMEILKGE